MRKVVNYPDPVLRKKTEVIKLVDKELENELNDLVNILNASENGAGLAAPQIGAVKRFFGLKNQDDNKVVVYFNPKVEKVAGERIFPKLVNENKDGTKSTEDFLEGCLSFPGYWGTVKRFLRILASWEELEEGKLIKKSKEMRGFEAVVFQHELDHLDGILFIDRIKEDQGKFFKQIGKEMVKWDVQKIIDEGVL